SVRWTNGASCSRRRASRPAARSRRPRPTRSSRSASRPGRAHMSARSAVVIGAGPTGATLAILLARRGYRRAVFEQRPDLRRRRVQGGRSINLSLMARGVRALEHVGVLAEVTACGVPIRSRAIHTASGTIVSQPLGRTPDEHVWAVDRNALNGVLLDRAESL